jgi:hypothetical protein
METANPQMEITANAMVNGIIFNAISQDNFLPARQWLSLFFHQVCYQICREAIAKRIATSFLATDYWSKYQIWKIVLANWLYHLFDQG